MFISRLMKSLNNNKMSILRKSVVGIICFLWVLPVLGSIPDTTAIKPKAIYGREAQVVAQLLDSYHYRKIKLNDSLSSVILDAYLNSLDNGRSYFISSDIKAFEKYRFEIDDYLKNGKIDFAFDIYNAFRKRFNERMKYVLQELVGAEYDFDADEILETDRSNLPWVQTMDELNDYWRRYMKNQVLSLKLTGKDEEEIKDVLTKRFERFIKNFEQTNAEDVFNLFMNNVTEAYDPHTGYFSPRTSDLFKQNMSLSLEGIGARLQTDNDYTKVVEVLPGGPAQKSNLVHVNDRIIGVAQGEDGEMVDVIGWRIDDVVKLIKGPKGTIVRLNILPASKGLTGPPEEIKLVRDKVKLEDQAAKKQVIEYNRDGRNLKLGVISIPTFYMDFDAYQKGDKNYTSTTRDVKRLIGELQKEGINGLLIDLRNNGGGSLSEAIDLTGLFIKNGPVVQVRNSFNKIEVGYDENPELAYSGPLLVLTNRMSASASEIFAGAIQDYQRGIVVGESTFGKGTVQSVIDLERFIKPENPDDKVGQLKITLQKFYRVTGSSTQNLGISPDINLPSPIDAKEYGESSNPGALPWDVIKGTNFQKTADVTDKTLAKLTKAYQHRVKTDPDLINFINETEETRKTLNQKYVSLNESVRRKEMEESEKRKAAEKKLNTTLGNIEIPASAKESTLDIKDTYLREGLNILSDLINERIG